MKNIAFRLAKFFFGVATWTSESEILRKLEENKKAEKEYYEKNNYRYHWDKITIRNNGKEV